MLEHFAARSTAKTITIDAVNKSEFRSYLKKQNKMTQAWVKGGNFKGQAGRVLRVPARDGSTAKYILGLGDELTPWSFARIPEVLPKGRYEIGRKLDAEQATHAAIAWGLATYRFTRYRAANKKFGQLVWPENADVDLAKRTITAIGLGRDLVNTPAEDLGPAELAQAVKDLGAAHGAKVKVISGAKLLDNNYPTIHAVGRAADKPPALADLRWKNGDFSLTLVGKGVCFDSGGLDLKGASGMRLMKKDMGGAASVLALASMIMDAELPLNLRVLVPTVENAVSGNAYRPGDVLTTRSGLTVEVGNTDAEGRLILCDALHEAVQEEPDLLVDFATLTGAARVALGHELPALFCDDDEWVAALRAAGQTHGDPVWRMPLHKPYRRHLDSRIADISNTASINVGGAITAALFLQEFVGTKQTWAHVDTMAWNSSARPGRPNGGDVMGIRAFYDAIAARVATDAGSTEPDAE